jgi:hypothetical protein
MDEEGPEPLNHLPIIEGIEKPLGFNSNYNIRGCRRVRVQPSVLPTRLLPELPLKIATKKARPKH